MDCFEELISIRRSIYHLGNPAPLPENEISRLIEQALKQSPTPFNSQANRLVLLYKEAHQKLWLLTLQELEKSIPPKKLSTTKEKIASFAAGSGTVLYFIDDHTTKKLQKDFPLYADKFPIWAEQASGILQYIIWTLLAEHHIGASLQHYTPLIDDEVHKQFKTPTSWRLIAQMPFGSIEKNPDAKTFLPISKRIKIFNG